MVVRHAEKPIAGRTEAIRARGDIGDASLTARGWQRAGALVAFFRDPASPSIGRPDHMLAVRFDSSVVASSRRFQQTLRPPSEKTGTLCDQRFGEGQKELLAATVSKLEGTTLVDDNNLGRRTR